MPAVVRIKRRIDEEPHTAFVLNGKRRRLQNDENAPDDLGEATGASASVSDKDELTTVLKFAGTLEKQVRRDLSLLIINEGVHLSDLGYFLAKKI